MRHLTLLFALALALGASIYPDPWAGSEGLDVVRISSGESVVPSEHLAPDKFTIVDIGAPWCSPCHQAAKRLQGYVAEHADVAVRAVSLDGSPTQSPQLPAAKELLPARARIPYFLVYAPDGEELYRGNNLERALRIIGRHR